ncbi:hypothetical protein [Microlunatus speluncae]|uniref:hypothetical protein n=1 Tax=Microlunatus speluncae TaxID=2594267 RepID=UPI001266704E|nr:hypothetical protein [Microlunatus speluncae]
MLRRVQGPIFGLLLGLIMLAGCAADGGNVASAGGDEPGADPSAAASKDPRQAALDYVECLREHGLEVDDPGPDGRLKLRVQGQNGQSKEAMEACRDLAPQMDKNNPKAKEQAERSRQFAACMRENGVEKFPDPDPNSPGIQINKDLADDPDFEAAQVACRDLLGALGDK